MYVCVNVIKYGMGGRERAGVADLKVWGRRAEDPGHTYRLIDLSPARTFFFLKSGKSIFILKAVCLSVYRLFGEW